MYQKILEIFKNIIVISKFTKTSKKKRSVFLLGLIGNLLVLSDILIILIFASFFDQNIDYFGINIEKIRKNRHNFPPFIITSLFRTHQHPVVRFLTFYKTVFSSFYQRCACFCPFRSI